MKAIYSVSLKLWLPLLMLGTFALLLSIMTWMHYQDRATELVTLSRNFVSRDMASLQREMEERLRTGEYVRAGQALSSRGTNTRYQALVALDERGRILHTTRLALKNMLAEKVLEGFDVQRFTQMRRHNRPDVHLHSDGRRLNVYFPLRLTHSSSEIRSLRSGALFASYDLSTARADIWAQIWRASLPTWLLLLIVMMVLTVFLHRVVTRPISHLVRVAGRLAGGGSVLSDIRGSGELVGLGEAFNEMSGQLMEQTEILQESEARYRTLSEETPVWICRFLPGGEITYANGTYCDYLEKSFGELLGSSFLLPLSEADREAVMGKLSALTAESPNHSHEHQMLGSHGELRWQHWSTHALFDEQGRAVFYQSIGEDVTERKHAEKLSTRFGRVVEDSLNEIYIFDSGTLQFLQATQGVRENLGYSMEELKKLTPLDISPEFTAETFADLIAPLRSGAEQRIVYRTIHRRKDDSRCPVEVHLQLIDDEPSVFLATTNGNSMRAS